MSDAMLPDMPFSEPEPDAARDEVLAAFRTADPDGKRMAAIFRSTFDQLYDGQHTGRYRWDQLFKTEKTHFGTLLEINIRKAFDDVIDEPADSDPLDYKVRGHDVDCKYSQRNGGWMLPPECFGQLLLVATADDARGVWSLGVVRASDENRNKGQNRDAKASLSTRGRGQIVWLHIGASLPPNILLGLDPLIVKAVFAPKSGQKRVTELLKRVTNLRIGRNTIATLAQQDDYMARLRDNGNGARSTLRGLGYLIPGGDYEAHRQVARQLGALVPEPGEVVSLRVVPVDAAGPWTTRLDDRHWRLARDDEECQEPAPKLPSTRKAKADTAESPDSDLLI